MLEKLFGGHKKRVFLDYASATPTRVEVVGAMREYSQNNFANPSALYIEARKSKVVMDEARAEVGQFLNCAKERVVFTTSGTEANNLALLGVFESAKKLAKENAGNNPHIITVATEHSSIREVLEEIKSRGGEVTVLMPDEAGLVSVKQIVEAIKENTVLISVMYVNNEIGVVQPIRDIAQEIRKYRKEKGSAYPYFHTDACQTALFYTLDVSTLGVDMLTLDGLKIGGPHGIGCLYVGHDVKISPVIFGGGQEGGLRSGTENISHMVGFAKALSLAKTERKELSERLEKFRDYFIDEILKKFPNSELNGSRKFRSPNNINVCFKNIDAEYLVVALDTYGVAASYSSSCRTLKEDSSSYVVESLGKKDCSLSSVRFTLGRETTKSDIDFTLEALEKATHQVKK